VKQIVSAALAEPETQPLSSTWVAGLEHQFVAHVRAGSSAIGIGATATSIHLALSGAPDVEVRVARSGPGDVTGLAAGAVARTVPRAGADDFEPNQLVAVELVHPALAWMPAAPDAGPTTFAALRERTRGLRATVQVVDVTELAT
jgi:hypothetical protein